MDLIHTLLFGNAHWGGGVAHSIMVLALVIALGIMLGKITVKGVSLGVTGILFVGIASSHFGITMHPELLHFVKELGLILFVFSIGLQVGPGFFSSFKKGGATLNGLAVLIVLLGVATTVAIHLITGTSITTMVGVMSGAVTNTPGLGAAQQAFSDINNGANAPEIASGYAVAYPLGVIGAILVMMLLKPLLKINIAQEEKKGKGDDNEKDAATRHVSVEVNNVAVDGFSVGEFHKIATQPFVISRIKHKGSNDQEMVNAETILHVGDIVNIVASPKDVTALVTMLGNETQMDWYATSGNMISRRLIITKSELNGRQLSSLHIRNTCNVTITRINRAGIDFVASGNVKLQMGDRVTVVGSEIDVAQAERLFGNSPKRLDHPNLIPIFVGIALGVLLGSISFNLPGVPQPVKLGLAGGPLIVAILIGCYGPKYKLVTYTTISANLMLREIGISLFMAGVGLGAGETFVPTIINGGYMWVGYGAAITIIPLLIAGIVGYKLLKVNFLTLLGVMSGSSTNPPALAFANQQTDTDLTAVGYATVYPLAMFMRVLCAQLLILIFA